MKNENASRQSRKTRKSLASVERSRQAVQLRIAGASYDQIAAQLGYNDKSAAYKAVERTMRAAREELREVAEERIQARDAELQRCHLEAWAVMTAPKAPSPGYDPPTTAMRLAANKRVQEINESRRKLFGDDAPTRTELTGRDGAPIGDTNASDALLGKLARLVAAPGEDPSDSH